MVEKECIEYAASSEKEVCGFILNNSSLFRCENIHPTPEKNFRISDLDWVRAEDEGEITAIFHSHPSGYPILSGADRQQQILSGLPWWLASGEQLRKINPVPHLLGRKFNHGKLDCFSIFRDAYHLCGIDLPDFDRKHGWWLRGENLYLKNLPLNGFYEIDITSIQPGDVIIRRPFPEADPCHSMLYLGENVLIHHDHAGHYSRRVDFRLAYIKQLHSVWRHKECSRLDLRGVWEDISAKSL
jgi:Predicted metal-dependent protease of the PAD1/JAB1 superfamily